MKRLLLIVSLFVFISSFVWAAGPATPTNDVVSSSKVNKDENIQLPYQPTETSDDQALDDDLFFTDEKEKGVDWDKVPYVPAQYPVVGPAKDPKL